MQKLGLGALFGAAALLLVWAISSLVDWSRPKAVSGEEVAYICLETHELIRGPVQTTPAVNPKTGRNTLVPAVYSTRDRQWVAAPPEEVLRGQRRFMSGDEAKSPLRFAPEDEATED